MWRAQKRRLVRRGIVQQKAEGTRAEHSAGIADVSLRHWRQFIILGSWPFIWTSSATINASSRPLLPLNLNRPKTGGGIFAWNVHRPRHCAVLHSAAKRRSIRMFSRFPRRTLSHCFCLWHPLRATCEASGADHEAATVCGIDFKKNHAISTE